MDKAGFWELVDRVRTRIERECRNMAVNQLCAEYERNLSLELRLCSGAELESFQDHLQVAVAEAYTSQLYAASYLVNGGGSLDGFYYFRAWLVLQGREVHQHAITDPDSLAEVCTVRGIVADYECEEVLNVAKRLFEERMGKPMDWRLDPEDQGCILPGDPWEVEDLPNILPRLSRIHLEREAEDNRQ